MPSAVHRPKPVKNYDQAWLTARLEAVGSNQTGLANVIGKHRSAITTLLKGRRMLKVAEIEAIAKHLQVGNEEVLEWAGLLNTPGAGRSATEGLGEMGQVSYKSQDAYNAREILLDPLPNADSRGRPLPSLFGCMKGTSFVMPGVDLTQPADPDWAKVYDDDYDHGVVVEPFTTKRK